jgi:hypothetical protein
MKDLEELLKLNNKLQKALDDNDEILCCDIINVLCDTNVTLGIYYYANLNIYVNSQYISKIH